MSKTRSKNAAWREMISGAAEEEDDADAAALEDEEDSTCELEACVRGSSPKDGQFSDRDPKPTGRLIPFDDDDLVPPLVETCCLGAAAGVPLILGKSLSDKVGPPLLGSGCRRSSLLRALFLRLRSLSPPPPPPPLDPLALLLLLP